MTELDDNLAAIIASGPTDEELQQWMAELKVESDRMLREMPTDEELNRMIAEMEVEIEQALRELLGPSDNQS